MNEENDITDLIKNRRSHRKYINKEISDDVLETIINCGRNAPFGGKPKPDCQVTEYIVIKDGEVKEKLALTYEDRQFIKDAPIVIAVLANKSNDPKYEEYVLSTALAIENLIISAESFGIGSCVLSCFMNHQKHIEDKRISREILSLPENIELVALVSLGYKDEKEQIPEKNLRPYNEVVHFEKY
ncbi:MAG: nitroreductase family protein [Alphaproteobacteria bacterium]|nr:nitroreductase family protein [Alphaproteobacteria bacterium]